MRRKSWRGTVLSANYYRKLKEGAEKYTTKEKVKRLLGSRISYASIEKMIDEATLGGENAKNENSL